MSRVRLNGFDLALEGPVEALVRALRGLGPDQGRIARRSARRRVSAALKAVRDGVGEKYPIQRRRAVCSRRRRTPAQRHLHLVRGGWLVVPNLVVLERIAVAGIRIQSIPGQADWRKDRRDTFAPRWAITIATEAPEKLARAKRSPRERKAILTELAPKAQA